MEPDKKAMIDALRAYLVGKGGVEIRIPFPTPPSDADKPYAGIPDFWAQFSLTELAELALKKFGRESLVQPVSREALIEQLGKKTCS